MRYKSLGFCCCVITDHVYSSDAPYSNNLNKFKKQLEEANKASKEHNIPVILGAEFSISQSEECLVFGTEAILYLLHLRNERKAIDGMYGIIFYQDLIDVKEHFPCAVILCHPILSFTPSGILQLKGHLALDGFERINSCCDFFKEGRREIPKEFEGLLSFCNSDSHNLFDLGSCYNLVAEPITTDLELIEYIKARKPVFHVIDEEPSELYLTIMGDG